MKLCHIVVSIVEAKEHAQCYEMVRDGHKPVIQTTQFIYIINFQGQEKARRVTMCNFLLSGAMNLCEESGLPWGPKRLSNNMEQIKLHYIPLMSMFG